MFIQAVVEVEAGGVGARDLVVEVDQEQEQTSPEQEKEEKGVPDLLVSSLEDMRSKMDGLIEKLRKLIDDVYDFNCRVCLSLPLWPILFYFFFTFILRLFHFVE